MDPFPLTRPPRHASFMRWLGSAVASSALAANPALFTCLSKHAHREIEPFLRFNQLLLDALDITFKGFEARRDAGRR